MPRSGCSALHWSESQFKKKRYGNFVSARIKLVFNDKLRFSPRNQQLFDKFIKKNETRRYTWKIQEYDSQYYVL